MPHFFIDKLVVTKEELIPDFWARYEDLKHEIWRYKDKDYGVKRIQRGGGNGRQLLIAFDSLPIDIQEAIGDPRKEGHILEHYYKRCSKALDFYSEFQYDDGSYLPPDTIQQYTVNASVANALLDLKRDRINEIISKGGSTRSVNKKLLEDCISFNEVLSKKYNETHNLPTSKRFKPTLELYASKGHISLIKDIEGKRRKNALKLDEDTTAVLNSMFTSQKNKPTPVKIADQYNAFLSGYLTIQNTVTGEEYNPKDFKELSESSISNYLRSWESSIGTHAIRNGDRQKLRQLFIPYHSLKQAKYAGSLLSIDDRQPPFEYEKGKRMWFYNAIDLGSEAFTCWVWGKTKEGIILDFYRQLIRNYHEWGLNIPDGLECESSLNSSFKDTFLKEGVMFQNVKIEANNARGKRIEAYYRQLRYKLEKEREGWLARPFALSEPNQISNVKKKPVPYNKLAKECLHDIWTWNNMEHSKIKGKSRWEVFIETQNPDLKPTNYKALLPHLGYHRKTSCNAGIVLLNRGKWLLGDNDTIYTGSNLINLMRTVESETFDVYWMDDNKGNIFKALVYIKGRYICQLLPKPSYSKAKIEFTPADAIAREIMSRYALTVESFMKEQKNNIDTVIVGNSCQTDPPIPIILTQ
ncbi:hypothetical protein [Aquimarina algiphila]|uniref:Uncharacterized protein n=1 Tax=Aquimarina algiphila TaxID=2047982 RepID=A0A554VAB3_9FLAO|nr:hypothetical protein [Aquimarina algiphila]TSE02792.1 hypothetical protein FOF46_30485 [Aquimarina algiphila]